MIHLHKYTITKLILYKSQPTVNKKNLENLSVPVFLIKVVKVATVLLIHRQETESRTEFQPE